MNISKYTKQDGDDHFFGALRFLVILIFCVAVVLAVPFGLAKACETGGLNLWIGCLIFYGLELCCFGGCMLAGLHEFVHTVRSSRESRATL